MIMDAPRWAGNRWLKSSDLRAEVHGKVQAQLAPPDHRTPTKLLDFYGLTENADGPVASSASLQDIGPGV